MQYLSDKQIVDLLDGEESTVIEYMERVFEDYRSKKATMIPKIYLTNDKGDYRAMPAQWMEYSGVKWISVYPQNWRLNIPTIHGTLLLSDTHTGQPLMCMDCAELTAYRTAAVSALAGKYLTIPGIVRTLTIIGCGYQAKLHLKMYKEVFPNINAVRLYDKDTQNAIKFKEWVTTQIECDCSVHDSVKSACSQSDVITTLTPSTEGYLGLDEIEHPFHINAIGADAVGKRELKDDIWDTVQLVVDDYEQAFHSGEAQYCNSRLPYLTLPDIITGNAVKIRDKTTVFDSTGLAIEDIAIGTLIHDKHYQRNRETIP